MKLLFRKDERLYSYIYLKLNSTKTDQTAFQTNLGAEKLRLG